MRPLEGNYFNIGRRLTLTLALLIALILGGNGLVISEFQKARRQNDRLTSVSQQLIAVLQLQESLHSFHQRLNELIQSRDARLLETETKPLRAAIVEQTRQTQRTLAYMPPDFHVDPAFLTALDAIENTLPTQIEEITALARIGDWEAVSRRFDNESRTMETTTAAHVRSLNRDLDDELPRAVSNMRNVQHRILLIVPATAISTVLVAVLFGWAIARRILELRLEERVRERTRIARELHDTLLQSFQGVLMKLSVVPYQIPDHPDVQENLEAVIEQARKAVMEGRDAVQGLRSSTAEPHNLVQAIRTFGGQLAAGVGGGNAAEIELQAAGAAREFPPLVWDEVYRIACEAVRNAFQHAEGSRILVEIHYAERQFLLTVRDNGKGIDAKTLEQGGRLGHHGLPGMRERAKLAGGKLSIWSEPGSGTEVKLTIPAASAYARTLPDRESLASGTGNG